MKTEIILGFHPTIRLLVISLNFKGMLAENGIGVSIDSSTHSYQPCQSIGNFMAECSVVLCFLIDNLLFLSNKSYKRSTITLPEASNKELPALSGPDGFGSICIEMISEPTGKSSDFIS